MTKDKAKHPGRILDAEDIEATGGIKYAEGNLTTIRKLYGGEVDISKAVDDSRKKVNANYIYHAVTLARLDKVNFDDPLEIADRTEEYLKSCIDFGIKPTVPGYALALGFSSVRGLQEVFQNKRVQKDCSDAVAKGYLMIEEIVVECMLDQRILPATAIFTLKNHFGYKDESDLNVRAVSGNTSVDQKALEDKYNSVIDVDYERANEN